MYTEYIFENREYDVALRDVKSILFDIVMTEQAKVNAIISKVKTTGDQKLQEKLITLCNEQAECLRSLLDISNSFRENLQLLDSYSRELKRIENKNIANIITGMRSKNKRARNGDDAAVQEEMLRQQAQIEQQAALQAQQQGQMPQQGPNQQQGPAPEKGPIPQHRPAQQQGPAPEKGPIPQPGQTQEHAPIPQPGKAPEDKMNVPAEDPKAKEATEALGLKIPANAASGVIRFNSSASGESVEENKNEEAPEAKKEETPEAKKEAAPDAKKEEATGEEKSKDGSSSSLELKLPANLSSGIIRFRSSAPEDENKEEKPAEDAKPDDQAEENKSAAPVEGNKAEEPKEPTEEKTEDAPEENKEESSKATSENPDTPEKEDTTEKNKEESSEDKPTEESPVEELKEETADSNTVVAIPQVKTGDDNSTDEAKDDSTEENKEENSEEKPAEEGEKTDDAVVQIPIINAESTEENKEETPTEEKTEGEQQPEAATEAAPAEDTATNQQLKFKKVSNDEVKAILTSAKQIDKLRESEATQEALLNSKQFFEVSTPTAETGTNEAIPVEPVAEQTSTEVVSIPMVSQENTPQAEVVPPVADQVTQIVQPVQTPAMVNSQQAAQPVIPQVAVNPAMEAVQPQPAIQPVQAPTDANLENQLMNNGLLPQDAGAIQATINQKMEQAKQLYATGQQEAAQALYNEISELSKNIQQPVQPAMVA